MFVDKQKPLYSTKVHPVPDSVQNSKSFGLITRVGSSPTTGTIIAPKCHASEHFLLRRSKDLNIFRKHWKNCICRRNLAGEIQMRVDIGCGADVTMPQPFLNFFQTHTIGVQQAGTAVPLRYNNDKRKKPLFSRGLSVCRHLFNSFSKLKCDEKIIEKRRLFH